MLAEPWEVIQLPWQAIRVQCRGVTWDRSRSLAGGIRSFRGSPWCLFKEVGRFCSRWVAAGWVKQLLGMCQENRSQCAYRPGACRCMAGPRVACRVSAVHGPPVGLTVVVGRAVRGDFLAGGEAEGHVAAPLGVAVDLHVRRGASPHPVSGRGLAMQARPQRLQALADLGLEWVAV